MRLVDDWRKCWRMHSIHAITALGMLGAIADWMPIVREFVPGWVYLSIMCAGIAGRMLSQKGFGASKDES